MGKATAIPIITQLSSFTPSLSSFGQPSNLSVIKDPYSGKYYGDSSYKDFIASLKSASSFYNNVLTSGHNTMNGNSINDSPVNILGGSSSLGAQARNALASIGNFSTLTEDNYVHHPMVTASYSKDPEGWSTYFEGNYKNPREAESNASAVKGSSLVSNQLSIPTETKSVKTVGTGIAASPTSNPFGALDSGLNI